MSEELALDQLRGNGGAVDLDERTGGTRAERVNRARDKLLAGSVVTGDQYSRGRRSHFLEQADHVTDRLARADNLVLGPHFLLEADILVDEHDVLQGIPQRQQDAIGVERLFEKVVGAELRRLNGGLDRAMTRDHHDLRLRIELTETLQRLEAIHAFHFDVEKDEMRLEFGVDSRGFMAGRAGLDFDLLELEDLLQGLTNALLIVDDQHAAGTQRVALRRRYKTTPVG